MSSPFRKVQKSANQYKLNEFYEHMTPEMYREGIRSVAAHAAEDVGKEYEKQIAKLKEEYNTNIKEGITMAMDTLAIEFIYELGNVLECYNDEPTYLEQKVEIVQKIYENAMNNIKDYAKYKNDNQAQKVYEKKKKLVENTFNIYRKG